MGLLETIKEQLKGKNDKKFIFSRNSMVNGVTDTPIPVEKTNYDYVWYGENNLYPLQLKDLSNASSIHGSILKTKSKMMAGDGFLLGGTQTKQDSENYLNSLQGEQKAQVQYLLENKVGGMPLTEVARLLAQDYQHYGAMCYLRLYNSDFTKLAGIKYVKVENVRAGKCADDEVKTYYYNRDWRKFRQSGFKPTAYPAYCPDENLGYSQMVYIKAGIEDYYGVAPYASCINWIFTDMQMSIFHRSNMENGMNPGLHFKFYKLPSDEIEEQAILDGIKEQWQGAQKTGKMIATFSEGKEMSMDIAPVEVSNLDKQLMLVANLCDQKILTGHQLTTPLLAGISTSGQLGGNTELETGWEIFDTLTVGADRSLLENEIKKWFDLNAPGTQIAINKFKPFTTIPKANG